jgi:phenylacetic acid degradation protein
VLTGDVTVGEGAVLHGCRIGRNALVGMNALVMDRAEVGEDAFVGAMTFVKAELKVQAGILAAGMPTRIVREPEPDRPRPPSLTAIRPLPETRRG